jgi:hypothetical protein
MTSCKRLSNRVHPAAWTSSHTPLYRKGGRRFPAGSGRRRPGDRSARANRFTRVILGWDRPNVAILRHAVMEMSAHRYCMHSVTSFHKENVDARSTRRTSTLMHRRAHTPGISNLISGANSKGP